MRGKGDALPAGTLSQGITPARAGKRVLQISRILPRRDHPRACGEKWRLPPPRPGPRGSPPRVRGKVQVEPELGTRLGITPARAGKSRSHPMRPPSARDHPRACGEKPSRVRLARWLLGSPPRVRGKGKVKDSRPAVAGITPARAGKSRILRQEFPWLRDHPRACGEKYAPHGQGLPDQGITPARAGKSGKPVLAPEQTRGSPPRVRGKD